MANIDAPASGSVATQDPLVTMRRVAVVMFLFGGLTCLAGAVMKQSLTSGSQLGQTVLSVVFLVTGLALCAIRRPTRRLLEVSVLWAIAMLSVLMAVSNPLGMGPVFFLWPVVYAAYFSSRRMLAVAYGWMAFTFLIGLALNSTHEMKPDTYTGTVTTVGLMAALIAVMTNREARLRKELAIAAETDHLTGLINRRAFSPRLEALVAASAAEGSALSVIMFDLDHFKRLNDAHGHPMGDRALIEVAAILHGQSREDDLVSRFGGEEFAVVLPDTDLADARVYTERVATALLLVDLGDGITLSTSVGISSLTDGHESADTLLQRADDALYAAKDGGRCRQAWWDDGIVVGPRFGDPVSAPAADGEDEDGDNHVIVTRIDHAGRARSPRPRPRRAGLPPARPAVVDEHAGGHSV
jgi:diguanylate cyclase (GGDEF)-like protein